MKYVLVTGGVVSGLGKGVTASSIGVILQACGHRVTSIKIGACVRVCVCVCVYSCTLCGRTLRRVGHVAPACDVPSCFAAGGGECLLRTVASHCGLMRRAQAKTRRLFFPPL